MEQIAVGWQDHRRILFQEFMSKQASLSFAVKPPKQQGILPGGGVALLRAQSVIEKLSLSGDEAIGADIVRRALESPLRQIAENAGAEGAIVVQQVRDSKTAAFGYNAATNTYEDLVKAGVIDPTKVVSTALQNAASVSTLLLMTEALVSEVPEKKKGGGGGDMGDMDDMDF